METNVVEVKVVVETLTGKQQPGTVKIQTWNQKERTKRAAKVWGAAWGLMLVSIFLPIAHFLLVPSFFFIGPIAGYFTYRQKSVVLGGESTCPQCLKPLPLERGPDKWPTDDMCALCQTNVTVKKA